MHLISFEELKEMGIPFSTQHLNRLIKAGHFPKAIKLGPSSNSKKAWLKADIDAWLKELIAQRDAANQ